MIKTLNAGIFNFQIYCYTGSLKKAQEYFIGLGYDANKVVEYFNGDYTATTVKFGDGNVGIHFPKGVKLNTIAHEFFHATEFILETVNIKHNDETSEIYAYLLDYLFKQWIQK